MPDPLEDFLLADMRRRGEMARDAAYEPVLQSFLGEHGLAEYRQLFKPEHLAPGGPPNLLFVPGVMGSILMNEQLGGIWWVDVRTRKHLDDLGLSPDGTRDADPENVIKPAVADTSYEPFFHAVNQRSDLSHEAFPYDWRKPLTASVDALAAKVASMRSRNGDKPVHLVGHSMGGLMIRTALWKRPELWDQVGRVVFVGTPHFGSPAIAGYLKNHFWGFDLFAVLGKYLSRSTFQSMWGVLSMLPAPSGVYPGTRPGSPLWHDGRDGHPAANFDLFDVDAYGLDDLPSEGASRLQAILSWVAQYHSELAAAHDGLTQPMRDRMLTIAGVGRKTLFRLERDRVLWVWDRGKKVTDRVNGDPHREGDGRVPVASAQLPNTKIRYVEGTHGGLTNIPVVWDEVFRFLTGMDLQLPDRLDLARGGHLALAARSAAPALDGTSLTGGVTAEDPGYLSDSSLSDERFVEIDAALERGEYGEFARVRLM